jgi:hypothetical protein
MQRVIVVPGQVWLLQSLSGDSELSGWMDGVDDHA